MCDLNNLSLFSSEILETEEFMLAEEQRLVIQEDKPSIALGVGSVERTPNVDVT